MDEDELIVKVRAEVDDSSNAKALFQNSLNSLANSTQSALPKIKVQIDVAPSTDLQQQVATQISQVTPPAIKAKVTVSPTVNTEKVKNSFAEIKKAIYDMIGANTEWDKYTIGRTSTLERAANDDRLLSLQLYNDELKLGLNLKYKYEAETGAVSFVSKDSITNEKQLLKAKEEALKIAEKLDLKRNKLQSKYEGKILEADTTYQTGSKKLVDEERLLLVSEKRAEIVQKLNLVPTTDVGIEQANIDLELLIKQYKALIKVQKDAQYAQTQLAPKTFEDAQKTELGNFDKSSSSLLKFKSISADTKKEIKNIRKEILAADDAVSLNHAVASFKILKLNIEAAENQMKSYKNAAEIKATGKLYVPDRSKGDPIKNIERQLNEQDGVDKVVSSGKTYFKDNKEDLKSFTTTVTYSTGEVKKLNFELAKIGNRIIFVQSDAVTVKSVSNAKKEAAELLKLQEKINTTSETEADTTNISKQLQLARNLGDKGKDISKEFNTIAQEIQQIQSLLSADKAALNKPSGLVSDAEIETAKKHLKEYATAQEKVKTTSKKLQLNVAEKSSDNKINDQTIALKKLILQIERYMQLNDNINKSPELQGKFQGVLNQANLDLENEIFDNVHKYTQSFADAQISAQRLQLTGQSFFARLSSQMQKLGVYFNAAAFMMGTANQIRHMISDVIDLDTAMTELKKVTDETDAAYSKFLDGAEIKAKRLGATLVDTVKATAEAARMGYSLADSEALADSLIVYKNVGDGVKDIEQASKATISSMKAFGIEAKNSISIIDMLNEVSNNFAVRSDEIGFALADTGAAFAGANNTIHETIGVYTGMNEIIQDWSKSSTAMRTIAARLRNTAGKLTEMGIDSDGAAESVTKLQQQLLGITNIDIMKSATEFKTTTQVLRELHSVWGDLSDKDRADVTRLVAGTRQQSTLQAVLSNWEKVEEAIQTSMNSEGSAYKENEKYLSSVQGRISQFKATYEDMSNSIVNSDMISGTIQFGTGILEFLTSMIDKLGSISTLVGTLSVASTLFNKGAFRNVKSVTGEMQSLSFIQAEKQRKALEAEINKRAIAQMEATLASDIKLMQAYETQVTSNIDKDQLFADTIGKGSKKLSDRTEEIVGGTLTSAQYAEQENKNIAILRTSAEVTKTATLATKALTFAKNMLFTAGLAIVVNLVTTAIDNLVHAEEKAFSKLNDSANANKNISDNLQSLQQELQNTSNKLDEISKKGKETTLTIAEEDERTQLQLTNAELQRKIELNKILNQDAKLQAETDALNAFKKLKPNLSLKPNTIEKTIEKNDIVIKNGESTSDYLDRLGKMQDYPDVSADQDALPTTFVDRLTSIQEYITKAKTLQAQIYQSEIDFNKLPASNKKNFAQYYETMKHNRTDELSKTKLALSEMVTAIQPIYDSLSGVTVEGAKTKAEIKRVIDEYIKLGQAQVPKAERFTNIFNSSEFADEKKAISELSHQFYLTADTFNLPEYAKLKLALSQVGITASDAAKELNAMSESVVAINTNADTNNVVASFDRAEKSLGKLHKAYEEWKTNKVVSADALSGLEAFKGLDSYSNFVKVLSNSKTTVAEAKTAISTLGAEYLKSDGFINDINEDTIGLIISRMESIGIVNAEEIAYNALNNKLAVTKAEKLLATNDNLNKVLRGETTELLKQAKAEGITAEALNRLTIQKTILADTDLSNMTATEIQNLMDLAKQAGYTETAYANMYMTMNAKKNLKNLTNKSSFTDTTLTASERAEMAAIQNGNISIPKIDVAKGLDIKYDPDKNKINSSSSKSSSGSSAGDKHKEAADAEFKYAKYLLDKKLITELQYYKRVETINDKYFKGKSQYLDEYREHEIAVLQGLEKLREEQFTKYFDLCGKLYDVHQNEAKYINDLTWALNNTAKTEAERLKINDAIVKAQADMANNRVDDLKNEVELLEKIDNTSMTRIAKLRKAQQIMHEEAERLRKIGYDNNSTQVQALMKGFWDLEAQIKSIKQEDVDATLKNLNKETDALEKIFELAKNIVKQEAEDKIDALEKQKDAYKEIIEAQKESIDLIEKSRSYNMERDDKTGEIAKLQAQADALALDDSREAKIKREELLTQIAEKQKDLNEFQHSNSIDLQKDALDKELKDYEKTKDKEIKELKDFLDNAGAITNAALKLMDEHSDTLYNKLLEWNKKHGDGINDTITKAWDAAKEAMERYGKTLDKLNSNKSQISDLENTKDTADKKPSAEFTPVEQAKIDEMIQNSLKWQEAANVDDTMRMQWYANRNQQLGKELDAIYDPTTGTWSKNGKPLYKFHDGGVIGKNATPQQDELIAVMQKGEIAMPQAWQRNLGKIIDTMRINTFTPQLAGILNPEKVMSDNRHYQVTINSPISMNGSTDGQILAAIKRHGRDVANEVYKVIK